jgi:hypothetical protein
MYCLPPIIADPANLHKIAPVKIAYLFLLAEGLSRLIMGFP